MTDNLKLPSWLSRGIEEYFPIKETDQTFSELIDVFTLEPNNSNCLFKFEILFALNFFNIYETCLLNLILKKYKSKNYL